ncbi:MAG: thiamine pyrophosphate-dependent dehydrogenase E1 component subunit alpha [Armatimonadetes bacterium]|nr:thiamine pyrophosphate-dependent dehydrogenase E1 component subunit alpha [Armatimonadota bacterium]
MRIEPDKLREMLRLMYRIRAFECRARQLFEENRMRGSFMGALHSCEGEEAVAVGACVGLRTDDYMLSTHRGHGHCIAKGGDVRLMMAELLGKEAGISKGRGGSMHMFNPGLGLLGGNGIVGGGIPLALGPAFSALYRHTDQVTVCFFGDGAACQGNFHESLNLASLWELPVIYICENNQYAVTTPASETIAVANIADRAAGYSCPGEVVDGNDVLAVYRAVTEAVQRARDGAGPTLLECKTYRWQPHCMVVPDRRDPQELARWREECDPIRRFEQYLLDRQIMDEAEQSELSEQAHETVEEAVTFAEASALPDPNTVAQHLWAED